MAKRNPGEVIATRIEGSEAFKTAHAAARAAVRAFLETLPADEVAAFRAIVAAGGLTLIAQKAIEGAAGSTTLPGSEFFGDVSLARFLGKIAPVIAQGVKGEWIDQGSPRA